MLGRLLVSYLQLILVINCGVQIKRRLGFSSSARRRQGRLFSWRKPSFSVVGLGQGFSRVYEIT